jgi:hypothetical protein
VCLVGHEVKPKSSPTPEINLLNITNDENRKKKTESINFSAAC